MAKSSRASTRKVNNQRLKKKVFGPVEAARMQRLSAKLLEIAAQPKPESDAEMKIVDNDEPEGEAATENDATVNAIAMAVDSTKSNSSSKNDKKRVEKRRKTSKIVFPSYQDRQGKKKGKK
ncbi:uncharacterized protein BCR38DRAFT_405250 [Pseudomassariella vexata]|uniref:DUF2423 domain-containing protein n=1 Tax=Pseudomassariella vexata TaxID=1141098 RepID=A0A1Y2ED85_9PEZI|nr:uncharacterized protein BCR38DRAFT_405250 [Pseudomassariella vexata]ORY69538.1 hypothetical protein BCR38DRAFT_405250 [Pseudomassariella vexata]